MLGALQTHTEIGHLHQRAHCLSTNANFLRNKACTDGNCFPIGTFMDVAAEAFSNIAQQSCWTPSRTNKALGSAYRIHCRLGRVYSTTCLSTHPHHAALRARESQQLCSMRCWIQGILIFSGCISTEELWMATNCSYYANATAHLEIAYVALLKMQELPVCKVQLNKPSLPKTFKPQNTESLLLIPWCTWLCVWGNHKIHLQIRIPLRKRFMLTLVRCTDKKPHEYFWQ